jgi:hypothetical protein
LCLSLSKGKKARIAELGLLFAYGRHLKKRLTKNDVDVIKTAILCMGNGIYGFISRPLGGL